MRISQGIFILSAFMLATGSPVLVAASGSRAALGAAVSVNGRQVEDDYPQAFSPVAQPMSVGDTLRSIPAPNDPSELTFDGTYLWMVSEQAGTAYQIDPADGSVVSTIPLPGFGEGDPNSYGITYDGTYLWHSDYGTGRIYKLDPATGDSLTSFPFSSILGLTWDGQYLWGSNPSVGMIYQINATTGLQVTAFTSPASWGIGLTFALNFLWVSDHNSPWIYKIDPADGSVVDSLSGPESGHLGLAYDGQYLWAAGGYAARLYQIDPGFLPTVISVPTDSLLATLYTGQTEVQSLRITNAGENDLFFDLSIQFGQGQEVPAATTPQRQIALARSVASREPIASISGSAYSTSFDKVIAQPQGTVSIAFFGDYVYGPLTFLQNAGYNAVQVYDADILSGALAGYDLLAMVHNEYTLAAGVQQAIESFVTSGGGLITEWSSSTLLFTSVGPNPYYVQTPQWGWFAGEVGNGNYITLGTPVDIIDPGHPLATDLADPFSGGGGTEYFYTLSGYLPELHVVAEYTGHGGTWPALMAGSYGSGAVVIHLFDSGDDMSYTNLQQLWLNSVQVALEGGVSWLSIEPPSGMVPPGEFVDIEATFDATNRSGHYFASIAVASNDTAKPLVLVPAHLTVLPAPDIAITPDTLDFGPTFVGEQDTLILMVANKGTDSLDVTGITITPPNSALATDFSPFTLQPRESHGVAVRFAPTVPGMVSTSLMVASNDPDESTLQVPIFGEGKFPPAIAVSPEGLAAKVSKGDSAVLTITIDNSAGQGALEWSAAILEEELTEVVVVTPEFTAMGSGAATKDVATESPGRPESEQLYSSAARASRNNSKTLAAPDGRSRLPAEFQMLLGAGDQPSLETVLENLNANHATVTNVIPQRFDFTEGMTGTYISDGDYDMYDGGNYLYTDLGGAIYYSDNTITTDAALGTNGRYFTRKYDGLFVFAADLDNVDYFEISGWLGADGDGSVDGIVLESNVRGTTYSAFVKRVYNSWDPSVNHMIIVVNNSGAEHEFSTYTDDDYHRVTELAGTTRMYYLLYAGYDDNYEYGSHRIDDHATQMIMGAFLEAAGLAPPWLALQPSAGIVGAGNSVDVDVNVHAIRPPGTYEADIVIMSNDPINPEVILPFSLHIPLLARPQIEAVVDVPGDQGGWVAAAWWASSDDRSSSRNPVLFYSIWMRGTPGPDEQVAKGIPAVAATGVQLLPSSEELQKAIQGASYPEVAELMDIDNWLGVGSIGATQDSLYAFMIPTLSDSNQTGTNWTYVMVTAHTAADPTGWVASQVDSSYSVDNLAPGVPQDLAAKTEGTGVRLSWTYDFEATEDFQYFAIYRGENPAFEPVHPDSVDFASVEPLFIDGTVKPATTYYYRIAAVDHNGNHSELTDAVSAGILDLSGEAGIPETYALRQNYPNPFNPSTTIRFDVPEATALTLAVYDILGREVVRLRDGYVEPGYHQVRWDGRTATGREVPTGVYILRLDAPAFTRHVKMVLMK